MTRDEAIKNTDAVMSASWSAEFVDGLAALGLLKLDEPEQSKPIKDRFTDLYLQENCANGTSSESFQKRLLDAGLKIVEV